MDNKILSFSGQYRYLSNFYDSPVFLDGVLYQSVEHAYQAAKTLGDRSGFLVCTAGEAKKLGRAVEIRPDWEEIKNEVMLKLLLQKFKPGSYLANWLDTTGYAELFEGNWWGDLYWGVDSETRIGKNILGKMLMAIRKHNRDIKRAPIENDEAGIF